MQHKTCAEIDNLGIQVEMPKCLVVPKPFRRMSIREERTYNKTGKLTIEYLSF